MSKITDREINTKPESKDKWLNETTIWGHGGLSVRITPKGDRLFYFRYTDSNSKRIRLPIGPYSKASRPGYLTLKEARLRASELASLHEAGIKDVKEHLIAQERTRKAKEEAELARIAREKAALEEEAARIASRKTVTDLFEHWASVDLIRQRWRQRNRTIIQQRCTSENRTIICRRRYQVRYHRSHRCIAQ
ncbi:Arm DNA-binding domain-containing protein [Marinobacterium jannaschii]|uniref:Arm DNA-binding domain-containing protein n=1 Tax=Marinobacterium jannaschii TaxID=64970 RepID=UPI001FE14289|nr:Arm DNA-binding domain-containing protein [Marinobacterium jannaschii]